MAQAEAHKSRRKPRLAGLIALALLAIGAASLVLMPAPVRDEYIISLQRHFRVWLASTGQPMPGTPDLARLDERLREKGMALGTPILMRVFKREFELELWMAKDGRFELFATYPICKWSGRLGPKLQTGDRQAPEGFYTVDKTALNPNSRWHRSFNLGFPNAYDRAHGRTGSFLMVHGGCGSIGCFAMTNPVIEEIWTIVTRALDGGQPRFQVQVYPFRMTDQNIARYQTESWSPFWSDLKAGHDQFERDRLPPLVSVCDKRYAFSPGPKSPGLTAPITAQCAAGKSTASLAGRAAD